VKLSTTLSRSGAATPDAVLLQEAAAGSAGALATLYDRYETKVFNYCLRLTGSREDAADATQEAFLGVLRRLKTDDAPVLNFSAYLFTAARHESYKVSRRRVRSFPSDELPERRDAADELAALESDPERSALVKSSQEEIRAANGRLPPRYREVLALHDLEGASYEQIGEILGMRGNAVGQLIFRARKRLRTELKAGAVASFVAASKDCERAQALISMREDAELDDPADADWLDRHLDECGSCRGSKAALVEVGAVYGAWVPVAAAAGLREDVLARGSELIGADWLAHANTGASNGAGSNGSAANGAEGSGRFATGAAGTTAVGLGILGLLVLLPGDEDNKATGQRDASQSPAAQSAAAEPAPAGPSPGAGSSSSAERSRGSGPANPGAAARGEEQRPARSGGRPVPRARKLPAEPVSPRDEQVSPRTEPPRPGPGPRRPRPPGSGAPVTDNSPAPARPPVAAPPPPVSGPQPAPPVQESPSSECSHPWKPTATKPCPPGHSKPKRGAS
jgi:RNA polymerase sigma factor (sigma-70 family)